MKESVDEEKIESSLICSICHKNSLDIKQNNSKLKKIFNEIFKNTELSELIQKCKCKNTININKLEKRDSYIYTHKYCILLKILFNFEIKCEACNTIFNIKIEKRIDKKKKIYLFIAFLIIYMMHLLIYLFCMFLLFINVVLKEYIKIPYKHIIPFFGVILIFINSLFLYFSIIKNIKTRKIYFYKYSINIFDINRKNKKIINEDSELYKLTQEFYQWFYSQSIINLLINKNKKFIINKGNYIYNNNIREYIKKNNIYFQKFIRNDLDLKDNIYNNDTKDIIINNNNNNCNILSLNNINNIYNKNAEKEENNLYSNRSQNSSRRDLNKNNVSLNNNDINRKISNNTGSLNTIDENQKTNNKDFINININQATSKNINIKIHINGEKSSVFDFSSSKEFTIKSLLTSKKVLKTALIPKNNIIKNLISESNTFKRKRRQLNSIKIRQKRLKLKGTKIEGSIEENEEIDFSEFEKIGSKISKYSKLNKKSCKNDFDLNLKCSNFRRKKSFKEVNLNISNSDFGGKEEISINRLSLRNNIAGKHVHFADS